MCPQHSSPISWDYPFKVIILPHLPNLRNPLPRVYKTQFYKKGHCNINRAALATVKGNIYQKHMYKYANCSWSSSKHAKILCMQCHWHRMNENRGRISTNIRQFIAEFKTVFAHELMTHEVWVLRKDKSRNTVLLICSLTTENLLLLNMLLYE
jgi:hypothetical protein